MNEINSIEKEAIKKVRGFLDSHNLNYQYLEHEPTPTSVDSARVRGTAMEDGIKALVVRGKRTGQNYMLCIPSNLKLDMDKVKQVVGESVEFEKPDILKEKYGLIIGGIPPLGQVFGIPSFFDSKIRTRQQVAFNCGSPSASIILDCQDYAKTVPAHFWCDISQL